MTPAAAFNETKLRYRAEMQAQERIARVAQARADELREIGRVIYGEDWHGK